MTDLITIKVAGKETSPLARAFEGRLTEVLDEQRGLLERAYPKAMAKGVTQPGKAKLRGLIEATGFYKAASLAKTWRAATYPAGKPSLEPAAVFTSKARTILESHEAGITITVHGAQFLAIPTGPAKGIVHQLNRQRALSGVYKNEAGVVQRVAAALGTTLIPLIDARKGEGVLVAANSVRLTRTGRMAKNQTGRPTVLFILVRDATLVAHSMGLAELDRIQAGFLGAFAAALAAELPEDMR